MWLGLETVFSLERCPLWRDSTVFLNLHPLKIGTNSYCVGRCRHYLHRDVIFRCHWSRTVSSDYGIAQPSLNTNAWPVHVKVVVPSVAIEAVGRNVGTVLTTLWPPHTTFVQHTHTLADDLFMVIWVNICTYIPTYVDLLRKWWTTGRVVTTTVHTYICSLVTLSSPSRQLTLVSKVVVPATDETWQ